MSKQKLYSISAVFLLAGYAYMLVSYAYSGSVSGAGPTPCLFKNITGMPCPSCGATRSIGCLLVGNFKEALYWNPIGVLLFAGLIIIPLLLLYDWIKAESNYLKLYMGFERFMLKKPVLYLFICLIVINWIWNINKGL